MPLPWGESPVDLPSIPKRPPVRGIFDRETGEETEDWSNQNEEVKEDWSNNTNFSSFGAGEGEPNIRARKQSSKQLNSNQKKSKACRYYLQGKCDKGERCKFSHTSADGSFLASSSSSPFKKVKEEGRPFKKVKDEVRSSQVPTTPRVPCRYFAMGGCKKGEECQFLHQKSKRDPQSAPRKVSAKKERQATDSQRPAKLIKIEQEADWEEPAQGAFKMTIDNAKTAWEEQDGDQTLDAPLNIKGKRTFTVKKKSQKSDVARDYPETRVLNESFSEPSSHSKAWEEQESSERWQDETWHNQAADTRPHTDSSRMREGRKKTVVRVANVPKGVTVAELRAHFDAGRGSVKSGRQGRGKVTVRLDKATGTALIGFPSKMAAADALKRKTSLRDTKLELVMGRGDKEGGTVTHLFEGQKKAAADRSLGWPGHNSQEITEGQQKAENFDQDQEAFQWENGFSAEQTHEQEAEQEHEEQEEEQDEEDEETEVEDYELPTDEQHGDFGDDHGQFLSEPTFQTPSASSGLSAEERRRRRKAGLPEEDVVPPAPSFLGGAQPVFQTPSASSSSGKGSFQTPSASGSGGQAGVFQTPSTSSGLSAEERRRRREAGLPEDEDDVIPPPPSFLGGGSSQAFPKRQREEVKVRSYKRKDGTVVAEHTRAPPGKAPHLLQDEGDWGFGSTSQGVPPLEKPHSALPDQTWTANNEQDKPHSAFPDAAWGSEQSEHEHEQEREPARSSFTDQTYSEHGENYDDADSSGQEKVIGSCQHIYTPYDLYERLPHPLFEVRQDTDTKEADPNLLVKIFRRPDAGRAVDPTHVRPPKILWAALQHLKDHVMDANALLQDRYVYIADRFRSIRNDRSIQAAWSPQLVELTEQIARYLLLANHDLCAFGESSEYSEKQNLEQLGQTLTPLMEVYEDNRKRANAWALRCEAEFWSYKLLNNLPKVASHILQVPGQLRRAPDVRFAVEVYQAWRMDNYAKFFALARRGTLLQAALMHREFNRMRSRALQVMVVAFDSYPLKDLVQLLCFDGDDDARKFLEQLGLDVQTGKYGQEELVGKRGREWPNLPLPARYPSQMLYHPSKRKGKKYASLIETHFTLDQTQPPEQGQFPTRADSSSQPEKINLSRPAPSPHPFPSPSMRPFQSPPVEPAPSSPSPAPQFATIFSKSFAPIVGAIDDLSTASSFPDAASTSSDMFSLFDAENEAASPSPNDFAFQQEDVKLQDFQPLSSPPLQQRLSSPQQPSIFHQLGEEKYKRNEPSPAISSPLFPEPTAKRASKQQQAVLAKQPAKISPQVNKAEEMAKQAARAAQLAKEKAIRERAEASRREAAAKAKEVQERLRREAEEQEALRREVLAAKQAQEEAQRVRLEQARVAAERAKADATARAKASLKQPSWASAGSLLQPLCQFRRLLPSAMIAKPAQALAVRSVSTAAPALPEEVNSDWAPLDLTSLALKGLQKRREVNIMKDVIYTMLLSVDTTDCATSGRWVGLRSAVTQWLVSKLSPPSSLSSLRDRIGPHYSNSLLMEPDKGPSPSQAVPTCVLSHISATFQPASSPTAIMPAAAASSTSPVRLHFHRPATSTPSVALSSPRKSPRKRKIVSKLLGQYESCITVRCILALPSQKQPLKGLRGVVFLLSAPNVLVCPAKEDSPAQEDEQVSVEVQARRCWQRDKVRLEALLQRVYRTANGSGRVPLLLLFYPPAGEPSQVAKAAASRVQTELGPLLQTTPQVAACSVQPLFSRQAQQEQPNLLTASPYVSSSLSPPATAAAAAPSSLVAEGDAALTKGLCWLASRSPAPPLLSPRPLPPLLEAVWSRCQSHLERTLWQPVQTALRALALRANSRSAPLSSLDVAAADSLPSPLQGAEHVMALWNAAVRSLAQTVQESALADLSWPPQGPGLSSLNTRCSGAAATRPHLPPLWWNGPQVRQAVQKAFASLLLPGLTLTGSADLETCRSYMAKLGVPEAFCPVQPAPSSQANAGQMSSAPLESSLAHIFTDQSCLRWTGAELSSKSKHEAERNLQAWLGPVRHARMLQGLQWLEAMQVIVQYRLRQARCSLTGASSPIPACSSPSPSPSLHETREEHGLWTELSSGQLIKTALQQPELQRLLSSDHQTASEQTGNNLLSWRQTLEYPENSNHFKSWLLLDSEAKRSVENIEFVTPSFSPSISPTQRTAALRGDVSRGGWDLQRTPAASARRRAGQSPASSMNVSEDLTSSSSPGLQAAGDTSQTWLKDDTKEWVLQEKNRLAKLERMLASLESV
eukprot:g72042.t1